MTAADKLAPSRTDAVDRSGLTEQEFALELRAFLERNHPGQAPRPNSEKLAYQRAWPATLADNGWGAPAWPRRWGEIGLLDSPGSARPSSTSNAPPAAACCSVRRGTTASSVWIDLESKYGRSDG